MWILNGKVFVDGRFEEKDIRIEQGIIAQLEESEKRTAAGHDNASGRHGRQEEQVTDATGKYILPGLVDIHTHGRIGEDFSLATGDGLKKMLESYAACGVTAVLGTTMTNEPSQVEKSLRVLGKYRGTTGARLLGIHMEGPFLGKEKKGAHDAQYLKNPDSEWFYRMQKASDGAVRLVTIDPCLPGAEEFIKNCRESGIKVSLGHTTCDYKTAVQAQQAGADHVTHSYNAMLPYHHREPGLIGAAMDTGMYMELVCDGIHVHPSVVRMMFAAHPESVVLISDSIPAAGMPSGEYRSGGLQVTLDKGKATLKDGTIAGSAISLFDAMVNAIRFGVPAEAAVNSVTYLPAKSVGLESVAGCIAVGRKAELLMVDKQWRLEKVYCEE